MSTYSQKLIHKNIENYIININNWKYKDDVFILKTNDIDHSKLCEHILRLNIISLTDYSVNDNSYSINSNINEVILTFDKITLLKFPYFFNIFRNIYIRDKQLIKNSDRWKIIDNSIIDNSLICKLNHYECMNNDECKIYSEWVLDYLENIIQVPTDGILIIYNKFGENFYNIHWFSNKIEMNLYIKKYNILIYFFIRKIESENKKIESETEILPIAKVIKQPTFFEKFFS